MNAAVKPTGVQGEGREGSLMKRADAEHGDGSKNEHPWSGRARKSHVELSPTDWKARPGSRRRGRMAVGCLRGQFVSGH